MVRRMSGTPGYPALLALAMVVANAAGAKEDLHTGPHRQ